MNQVHFGTGGWRAIIGDTFTKENIKRVGEALARRIEREGVDTVPVVVGYDRRFLSKEAMIWFSEVLGAHKIPVRLIQKSSPTPLIMFYTMRHGLKYGAMITASHNPSLYNGIKLFTEEGRDANETVTGEIERELFLIDKEPESVKSVPIERLVEEGICEFFDPLNEYLDSLLAAVDVNAIRNAHLRIAVDPLFGVAARPLNTLLSILRCDSEMLNTAHDTLFAGKMPAPDKQTVRRLQIHVVDYNFDLGIATDGDADRIGLVDDLGNYISANETMAVLYYYFLKYEGKKTPVVKNLATTVLLNRVAEAFGEKCYEVPVGFKYISAGMRETGAILGGEGSGGMTVSGHINGKDALFAATLIVEMIAKSGKKLSELVKEVKDRFGYFYMEEMNLSFNEARREELKRRIYEEKDLPELEKEVDHVSTMDGCKVYFKDGSWLLIRFSGTEPLLRIFAEVPEKEKHLASEMCKKIKQYYGI